MNKDCCHKQNMEYLQEIGTNVRKHELVKTYCNMQTLRIGKASEEGGHHLDVIVVSETHIQTQGLNARDHGGWACFYPRLHPNPN